MKGKKATGNDGFGTQERPVEVPEESIETPIEVSDESVETLVPESDESMEVEEEREVEILEVKDEYPLMALYPDQPFPTTQREMELAELEAAKIYFNRQMKLMDEDPSLREEEEIPEKEISFQDDWYQTTEEYYPFNSEVAMTDNPGIDLGPTGESPQADYFDFPIPSWRELYGEDIEEEASELAS